MDPNTQQIESVLDEADPSSTYIREEEVQEVYDIPNDGDVPMDEDDNDQLVEDTSMTIDEGTIASGSGIDGDGAIEDVAQGQSEMPEMVELEDDSVQGFFKHYKPVYAIAIHPQNPSLILSGGEDDTSYLWNVTSGSELFKLAGHTDSVVAVGFSHDGKYMASGGMDGKICVYLTETGETLGVLEGPDEVVWINFHPKGPVILAGSNDGTIWMYSIPTLTCMSVFSGGHSSAVTAGQFTPDGKKFVSASDDSSFVIWDPKTTGHLVKYTRENGRWHQEGITAVAVNSSGTLVATGGVDGEGRLVNLANGNILAQFNPHSESIESISFSLLPPSLTSSVSTSSLPPQLLSFGSVDGTIATFDTQTFRPRYTLTHSDAVIKIQWILYDNKIPMLVSSSQDKTVRLWDGRTGECVKIWKGHMDGVLGFVVGEYVNTSEATNNGNPAGKINVVTAGDDGVCLVFRG